MSALYSVEASLGDDMAVAVPRPLDQSAPGCCTLDYQVGAFTT